MCVVTVTPAAEAAAFSHSAKPGCSAILVMTDCLVRRPHLYCTQHQVLWAPAAGDFTQLVVTDSVAAAAAAPPLMYVTRVRRFCDWRLVITVTVFGVSLSHSSQAPLLLAPLHPRFTLLLRFQGIYWASCICLTLPRSR